MISSSARLNPWKTLHYGSPRVAALLVPSCRRRSFGSTTKAAQAASSFGNIIAGPRQSFRTGDMAHQTLAAAIGKAGSTVVLTTVAAEMTDQLPPLQPSSVFLTNEFRERHHAVGQIPKVRHRRDNRILSLSEVLASRAIDRALRPLVKEKLTRQTHLPRHDDVECSYIHRWHVQSSLQAMNRHSVANKQQHEPDGDPIPLAINTAAAIMDLGVAAVSLGVQQDETGQLVVWEDSLPMGVYQHKPGWIGNLLYAGTTHGETVMMEWGAATSQEPLYVGALPPIGLADDHWPELLHIARTSLESRFQWMQEFRDQENDSSGNNSAIYMDDAALRASLGLDNDEAMSNDASNHCSDNDSTKRTKAEKLVEECQAFCEEQLREPFLRLCGWSEDDKSVSAKSESLSPTVAFPSNGDTLLSKSIRGRKEGILRNEVELLVEKYLEGQGISESDLNEEDRQDVPRLVFHRMMQKALVEVTSVYGCRPDGRKPRSLHFEGHASGRNTVRPIRAVVPALPESVHGSAHFCRGDTGVLSTVTLASPKEGRPDQDPFDTLRRQRGEQNGFEKSGNDYYNLPVGSLRFLRTQEALVSDLNSRNSLAEKERTGASGTLAEVQKAFLQYDFPDYSTGSVPGPGSQGHNRRALGHGALAEKALLPILPSPEDFPFSIRITAETVDSNGSSSMAAICAGFLALLDAGVPVLAPVAGISVGLATEKGTQPSEHGLLLDITGTEDHYGRMDFKVGGTRDAVTALQLDVKEPVHPDILVAALKLAKGGRNVVLNELEEQVANGLKARPMPKLTAPAVEVVKYDASRKRDLIGPGGVVLRQLEERYSVSIDLTQEGRCLLYGEDREMVSKAKSTVMDLVAEVEVGVVYEGTIVELKDFGAIVELLRNKEGILHVSELTEESEAKDHPEGIAGFVRDFLKVGQTLDVLCTGVDPIQGSIKLSRKALLRKANRLNQSKH